MTRSRFLAVLALALLVSACAAGGVESGNTVHQGMLSLFLLGLWHGIIAPITVLVEIGHKLWPHTIPWAIRLYEVRANAVAYDVGFIFGIGGGPTIAWRRASAS